MKKPKNQIYREIGCLDQEIRSRHLHLTGTWSPARSCSWGQTQCFWFFFFFIPVKYLHTYVGLTSILPSSMFFSSFLPSCGLLWITRLKCQLYTQLHSTPRIPSRKHSHLSLPGITPRYQSMQNQSKLHPGRAPEACDQQSLPLPR